MIKISIITAVYNCRNGIQDALDSVSRQYYGQIEHIVVDGGSTDGTVDVLENNRQRIAALVTEPDNGIYDALNKGLRLATGDVVGFLHADDVLAHDDAIGRIASAIDATGSDAAFGDLVYVSRADPCRVVRHWKAGEFSPSRLAWGWMPPHPTLYVRREWYERIGGFDARYKIAADYFSILRLFGDPEFRAVYIPEVLVRMRLGGASNRTLCSILTKSREDLDALRRSRVGAWGGFGALAWKNLGKIGQFTTWGRTLGTPRIASVKVK